MWLIELHLHMGFLAFSLSPCFEKKKSPVGLPSLKEWGIWVMCVAGGTPLHPLHGLVLDSKPQPTQHIFVAEVT